MRVVSGRFGGRRLKGTGRLNLRPTSELVRRALFDIIGSRVTGARALDLFAGTGGLGIEALSRGAAWVTFVERNLRIAGLLRANLALLALDASETEIVVDSVARALPRFAAEHRQFDLVLADPPYETGYAEGILAALADGCLLVPGGLAVLEHRASELVPVPLGLALTDRRVYGDTGLSFFASRGVRDAE